MGRIWASTVASLLPASIHTAVAGRGLSVATYSAGMLASARAWPAGPEPNRAANPPACVGTVSPDMSTIAAKVSRWRSPRLSAQYPPADMPPTARWLRSATVRSCASTAATTSTDT